LQTKIFAFLLYQWNRPNDYIFATMQSSGTHWLRFMIAKAFVDYFKLNYAFRSIHPVGIVPGFSLNAPSQFLYNRQHEIPRVQHTHFPYKLPWSILFRGKKVILLIRDLRDACVSHYRKGLRQGSLGISKASFLEFLKDPRGDIRKTSVQGSLAGRVEFLNSWGKVHAQYPERVLVVKYEDLRKNPARELGRVLRFLGLTSVDEEFVRTVVEFCSIENMRRIGRRALEAGTGRGSQEILAVNKGVVGQFKDLWTPEVDAYFRTYIARHLRYDFGYSYD